MRGPVTLVGGVQLRPRQTCDPLVGELHVLGRDLSVAAVELDAFLQLEVEAKAVRGGLERLGKLVDDLPGSGRVRH
jgi:hypothetical protein